MKFELYVGVRQEENYNILIQLSYMSSSLKIIDHVFCEMYKK